VPARLAVRESSGGFAAAGALPGAERRRFRAASGASGRQGRGRAARPRARRRGRVGRRLARIGQGAARPAVPRAPRVTPGVIGCTYRPYVVVSAPSLFPLGRTRCVGQVGVPQGWSRAATAGAGRQTRSLGALLAVIASKCAR
jgi:hypothetical protein